MDWKWIRSGSEVGYPQLNRRDTKSKHTNQQWWIIVRIFRIRKMLERWSCGFRGARRGSRQVRRPRLASLGRRNGGFEIVASKRFQRVFFERSPSGRWKRNNYRSRWSSARRWIQRGRIERDRIRRERKGKQKISLKFTYLDSRFWSILKRDRHQEKQCLSSIKV